MGNTAGTLKFYNISSELTRIQIKSFIYKIQTTKKNKATFIAALILSIFSKVVSLIGGGGVKSSCFGNLKGSVDINSSDPPFMACHIVACHIVACHV